MATMTVLGGRGAEGYNPQTPPGGKGRETERGREIARERTRRSCVYLQLCQVEGRVSFFVTFLFSHLPALFGKLREAGDKEEELRVRLCSSLRRDSVQPAVTVEQSQKNATSKTKRRKREREQPREAGRFRSQSAPTSLTGKKKKSSAGSFRRSGCFDS